MSSHESHGEKNSQRGNVKASFLLVFLSFIYFLEAAKLSNSRSKSSSSGCVLGKKGLLAVSPWKPAKADEDAEKGKDGAGPKGVIVAEELNDVDEGMMAEEDGLNVAAGVPPLVMA